MKNHNIAALVVWFLGIIGIILAVGVVWLTANGSKIDGGVFTLAGGAVGGLTALLTNTRQQQRQGDEPVPVTTPPGEPLEVTPATGDPVPA